MGKLKATLEMEDDPSLKFSLVEIAMTKAWNYIQEYNPTNGRVEERLGGAYLREGYIEGFLAGFAHKFEHSDKGVD